MISIVNRSARIHLTRRTTAHAERDGVLAAIAAYCNSPRHFLANARDTAHSGTVLTAALAIAFAFITCFEPAVAGGVYEHGFPTDRSFFPIGVWLQSPANAPKYRAMGINTFVGLWDGPTEAQLAQLSKQDMFVVAEQNAVGLNSVNAGIIKAWMQPDEPDNAQMTIPGLRRYSPCVPATEVAARSATMKSRDPTRPVLINFGRGVADPSWPGRGTCTGDLTYYDTAIAGADLLSFDIYPVGSDTPHVKGRLDYVARGVTTLLRRALPSQSVWALIETTALDPARPVKPEEVRAEVWIALIHGAKGIVYFVHEWAGGAREDGIFRHPDIVQQVTEINSTIASLAPVLNSPDLMERIHVLSPAPIATMAKYCDDALCVFAVAMQDQPSTLRLAIRDLGDAEAVVLGEGRSITIHHGVLEDAFSGFAVHTFKIPFQSKAPATPQSDRRAQRAGAGELLLWQRQSQPIAE
jgi:hypothetical protein